MYPQEYLGLPVSHTNNFILFEPADAPQAAGDLVSFRRVHNHSKTLLISAACHIKEAVSPFNRSLFPLLSVLLISFRWSLCPVLTTCLIDKLYRRDSHSARSAEWESVIRSLPANTRFTMSVRQRPTFPIIFIYCLSHPSHRPALYRYLPPAFWSSAARHCYLSDSRLFSS